MKRSLLLAAPLLGLWTNLGSAQPSSEPVADPAPAPAPSTPVTPTPPPAPPSPAVGKASSDDIDLGSLGLDPSAASFDDKLNLFGFADFSYASQRFSRDPIVTPKVSKGFAYGNLNVYLAKNLTPKARSLIEVRFTFLPNGSVNNDGTFVNTTARDITDNQRQLQWGAIIIERAYVEYDLGEHLTIRAGHWLTPYGIWNIDHGSPVIIGTQRPYIIGAEFFPEHQTGLDLFGTDHQGAFKIDYHLTASNGRGTTEAQSDQDGEIAFGGRLDVETRGLKLGGSYYRGRSTDLPASVGAVANTYLEAAYGADLQFDRGGLHVQAEVMARDRHYEDGKRAAIASGFTADGRDMGYYAIAGYRFDRLWNVMPYAVFENHSPADHTEYGKINAGSFGLNFRPSASLILKVQAEFARFDNGGIFDDEHATRYSSQASWVF
jgi:hypothetical protein